jgi:hypothetical protein
MLVTLSGIVTLLRDEQPLNANPPILVTLLGIVTLLRDLQSENALSPMLVTGHPPRVEGIIIAPEVDSRMAQVENSLPRLALPSETV